MDIYLRWQEAYKLLRYNEPGAEELEEFWVRQVSGAVRFSTEVILAIYERLHKGQFEVLDCTSAWCDSNQVQVVFLKEV